MFIVQDVSGWKAGCSVWSAHKTQETICVCTCESVYERERECVCVGALSIKPRPLPHRRNKCLSFFFFFKVEQVFFYFYKVKLLCLNRLRRYVPLVTSNVPMGKQDRLWLSVGGFTDTCVTKKFQRSKAAHTCAKIQQ